MFAIVKKIIGDKEGKNEGVSKEKLNADTALCVLLLETAHADGECSTEEKEQLISTLTKKFNISREEIDELVAGSYKQREDSVDIFRFTRYMNNNFTKEEKFEVMESVWRIILIDGRLEAHEDHLAHKLANLLRLTHKELIDCKIKARKQLNG